MSAVEVGALAFGTVIGWLAYSINRNRTDGVTLGDIATMIGAVGGGAILALFPEGSQAFGWYGIGLSLGFFGYFLILLLVIRANRPTGWTTSYLLDGRRPPLSPSEDRAAAPGMGHASDEDVNKTPNQLPP